MPPKSGKQAPDSVKVFLRVRPPQGREIVEKHTSQNLQLDPTDPSIIKIRSGEVDKRFHFHEVFGPQSEQQAVFEQFAKPAVNDALDGFHGVLFVYGQTGSGKTFTMSHPEPGKEGMLQRAMSEVWNRAASDPDYDYDMSVSYVQLYNEMLSDMLDSNTKANAVRLSGVADRRSDIQLVNETTNKTISRPVNSYDETIKAFHQGVSNRVESKTNMNAVSSRSHTVFTLYIKKQAKPDRAAVGNSAPKALEGRLIICDLAGSERIKKTDAKGQQLTEANSINGSLLVLGRVVAALTDAKGAQHVPYRESKLTRLLQYSLSGWGKTSLVVNVSPSDDNTEETLSSIQFGQRAIQIKQSAEKHETVDYKALYLELQKQVDKGRDELLRDAVADHQRQKESLIADYEDRIKILQAENAALHMQLAQKGAGGGQPAASATANPTTETDDDAADSGAVLFQGRPLQEIMAKIRERMEARDRRLQEEQQANEALRNELNKKETELFAIVERIRVFKFTHEAKRMELIRANAELSEKLTAATGVQYLSAGQTIADDDFEVNGELAKLHQGGAGKASTILSPRAALSTVEDGGEDNERLMKVVSILQQRVGELRAYNRTAARAIRMLHYDLEDAQSRLQS